MKAALQADLSEPATKEWKAADLRQHPLARWVELKLGLEREDGLPDGEWVRCRPHTLQEASKDLAEQTGLAHEQILATLRDFLLSAYRVEVGPNRRFFAFIDLEPALGEPWREWVVTRLQMDLAAAAAIEQRLGQLNAAIAADSRLGKAFRIGHSYVTPTQSLEGRSSRDWFAEVVASELKPLLQEYWFDAPEEAERQAAALLEGW
ncbi:MAG: hypothetical protein ER33_07285 [Cyanobium sp. CACIAM 14]|nr:MAG: hypothetical protein ER33_07285 [Cyanobium sp. CACIAM 14]